MDRQEAKREALQRFRKRNPTAARDWNRANPLKVLFKSIKANAKAWGRKCLITLEELSKLIEPMICTVTGLPLEWGTGDWAPSIDRIDSTGDYTIDNVRVVCWIFNRARGTSSDEAVLRMAQAIATKSSTS